jgi:myo-inositol-1(or 4)-monophosphatase
MTSLEARTIQTALASVSPYVLEKYAARGSLNISNKAEANDLVTEVDEEAQRRLAAIIEAAHPGDAIVGEELDMGELPADRKGRCWFIDPIDGTQNFVRGLFPIFGISVAFSENGIAQAGGVSMPVVGDTYLAERGLGAYRNGERLRVSTVPSLSTTRAEIDFGNPLIRQLTLERFSRILVGAGQVRCHCAAVFGLCSVASDNADGYFQVDLNPWDYAAAALIVEGAGGKVTRLDGSQVNLFDTERGILATNGIIHAECLRTIDRV